jgi:hypothetical protein
VASDTRCRENLWPHDITEILLIFKANLRGRYLITTGFTGRFTSDLTGRFTSRHTTVRFTGRDTTRFTGDIKGGFACASLA